MARLVRSVRLLAPLAVVGLGLALAAGSLGCDKVERWGSPWAASSAPGATSAVEPGARAPAASATAHH